MAPRAMTTSAATTKPSCSAVAPSSNRSRSASSSTTTSSPTRDQPTISCPAIAKARGYTVPDTTGHYLVHFRNNVWWSFDEAGLALGEDSYTQFDPDAWERILDENLP